MATATVSSPLHARNSENSGCSRQVPCDHANYPFLSQFCTACFDRVIAGLATLGGTEDRGHDEPRPTCEDILDISPEAEAEWSGFELGLMGFSVVGPAHYSPGELAAFRRGHAAGFQEYENESFDAWVAEQEWIDGAFSDPLDSINPNEVVEAIGAVAARKGVAS